MLRASNLAGKSIRITKTTTCHSVSYPITSYFGIPHGHAVGLTLAEMLVYNSEVTEEGCNDSRGAEYVKRTIGELVEMFGEKDIKKTHERIENLMMFIGLEPRLSKLGIGEKDKKIIIQKGFKLERVKNNPRVLTQDGLKNILEHIY